MQIQNRILESVGFKLDAEEDNSKLIYDFYSAEMAISKHYSTESGHQSKYFGHLHQKLKLDRGISISGSGYVDQDIDPQKYQKTD